MYPRQFALVGGIVMLALGILAFVPGLNQFPAGMPVLNVEESYGLFLGYFPMNIFNKVALIALGLAGVWASQAKNRSLPASIQYSRWVFLVTGVLAILGLFPQTNTLFGYWPLFGATFWEHAVFAVVAAYYGFMLTSKVPEAPGRHMPRESLSGMPSGTRA